MKEEKESLGSRSARTFSVLGIGRVIGLLLGILTVIVIARMLGPEGYGVYTLAFAFFMLIGATNNFGFGVYLTKHLAEFEEKKDKEGFRKAISTGYFSVTIIGLLLTLLGIVCSPLLASLLQSTGIRASTLSIASMTIFFFMLYGTSDYALIGLGKNGAAVIVENLENVVLLAASVILIGMGYGADGAIAGILISYIFAAAVGTLLVFRYSHKFIGKGPSWPTAEHLKGAFRFSLPVAVNNFLGNAAASFGTLFLGLFVSAYSVGNYGIANRASGMFALLYSTMAVTLLPTLTLAHNRSGGKLADRKFASIYNKVFVYSMVATVPLIAFFGVFSVPVVYLLFSQSFSTAPLYLTIMALGVIINLAGTYITSLFVAKGKTRQLIVYSLISALAQVVAVGLLVPSFGALGAVIAIFVIGGIADSFLFLRGSRNILGVRTDYRKLGGAFMSNIALSALFAIGLLLPGFAVQLLYGVVIMLLAYPPLLVLFGVIEKEDIETIGRSIERLPYLRIFFDPLLRYFKILIGRLQ
jgi:O-antigen/teichoic acid export membrane protein